jgi:hypothetical protein
MNKPEQVGAPKLNCIDFTSGMAFTRGFVVVDVTVPIEVPGMTYYELPMPGRLSLTGTTVTVTAK